jgi:hypothetical protein
LEGDISQDTQEEGTGSSSGTAIDSSEIDPKAKQPTVVKAGSFREKAKRFPTSSYLPGYTSNVESKVCPKCGFEAFKFADKCRCGTPL